MGQKSKTKNDTKKDRGPDGVVDFKPYLLNEEYKRNILSLTDTDNRKKQEKFVKRIELIIGSFKANKEFLRQMDSSKNTIHTEIKSVKATT